MEHHDYDILNDINKKNDDNRRDRWMDGNVETEALVRRVAKRLVDQGLIVVRT